MFIDGVAHMRGSVFAQKRTRYETAIENPQRECLSSASLAGKRFCEFNYSASSNWSGGSFKVIRVLDFMHGCLLLLGHRKVIQTHAW